MSGVAAPAPRAAPPLWRRAPLLPLALAWAVGLAGGAAVLPGALPAGVAAAFLLAAAALATALRRDRVATALLLLAVVALAGLRAQPLPGPADHVAALALPRAAVLEGRLAETPRRWAADRQRLLVAAEAVGDGEVREPVTGLVQVAVHGPAPPLAEGAAVLLRARLDRPAGFRNPGGFDYPAHLARLDVLVVGTARGRDVVALGEAAPPWPARVRATATATLARHLPEASAALLAGLLLGDRAGLPPEQDEAFRVAGVYHVLAVSGFNVALVGGAVFTAAAMLGLGRKPGAAAAAAAVVGFALVVGPQPSVLRAAAMGLALLAATLLERESQLLNALALATLAVLAWRPGDLHEPGFQLSFAATAGIVVLAPPLDAALRARGLPPWAATSLGVSLGAQLALTPVMLAHFNQLSLIGVLANLAVVPLAGAATVLGLLAVAVAPAADTVAGWLLGSVWLVLLALRAAVRVAAAMPAALVHLPAPGGPAILAWYAALALLPVPARAARAGAAGLGAAAIGLCLVPWLRPDDGRLRVTFLDVGQGDAALIEVPGGPRLLVDTGAGGPGRLDVGEHVLAPVLWNRALTRLDAVALTHPDPDHAGALPALLRRFAVAELWDGGPGPGGDEAERLAACAGLRRRVLGAGDRLRAGAAVIDVLHPDGRPLPGHNENSLVLRLSWRGVSVLLTGDLGAPGEARLLERGTAVPATVLKVGHHGSRFSSSAPFLAALRPRVAVISAGARNRFGHPTPAALARLAAAGARVYRTDRDGAVAMETDGEWLWITRWASRRTDRLFVGGAPAPTPEELTTGRAPPAIGAWAGAARSSS